MSQQIALLAIKSLVNENKEPTLARVKSRLTSRIAMPIVIDAIKAYKQNPNILEQLATAPEVVNKGDVKPSLEQRVTKLETQLAQLLERVAQLEEKN